MRPSSERSYVMSVTLSSGIIATLRRMKPKKRRNRLSVATNHSRRQLSTRQTSQPAGPPPEQQAEVVEQLPAGGRGHVDVDPEGEDGGPDHDRHLAEEVEPVAPEPRR